MIWLLILALVIMLTRVFTTGNTQSNGKKSPINLIRNASSKDASVSKPTPAPGRPSTAIDPLSHVRSRLLQLSYIGLPISNMRKHIQNQRSQFANFMNSTSSRGPIQKITYLKSYGIAGDRRVQTLKLEAQQVLILCHLEGN
jgi:hypothetical protein